jgi:methionyl aminopeptidase
MIQLKTKDEIELMKDGGKILKTVVDELIPWISVGQSTLEIDSKAEELIKKHGGEPSFKTVPGFSWTTCIPVNEQAVHTPPSNRILKDGDLVTVDIGVLYKGFHTDYAYSKIVGNNNDPEKQKFLDVGKQTLEKAISMVHNGVYIGEFAEFIYNEITKNGYFIMKELTGHGIGRKLHEDPYVLNYLDRPIQKTYKIKPGFVFALEIIYSMGSEEIAYEQGNSWSIISGDKSLSACFEKTLAVTEEKTFILT